MKLFLALSLAVFLAAAPVPHSKVTGVPQSGGKDKGIGPVDNVQLGPIDHGMARKGKKIFDSTCSVCHGMKEKKVGPPLGDVVNQRTPEFIMNLLVNTSAMIEKDPTMKQLEAQYRIKMSDVGLTRQQAREVLEYLREQAQR